MSTARNHANRWATGNPKIKRHASDTQGPGRPYAVSPIGQDLVPQAGMPANHPFLGFGFRGLGFRAGGGGG